MRLASSLGLIVAAIGLSGCQTPLPDVGRLPKQSDALSASRERFLQDAGEAPVRRVRVPGSSMQSRTVKQGVSPALRARPIGLNFPSIDATVADLVDVLSAENIQIAFRWQGAKAEDVLKKKLPFPRYAGTVGGLLDALRTGLGIVAWQEGQTIFLSDSERYAVALPQNEDVLKAVSETVGKLGATDVVTSLDGGKVIYSATPVLQDEIIGPFMARTTRNLSTISMQVAIVSLALNDKSAQGFDWSKLGLNIDGRGDAIANARRTGQTTSTNTNTTTGTGTNGTVTNTNTNTTTSSLLGSTQQQTNPIDSLIDPVSTLQKGPIGQLSKEDLLLGTTLTPKILGVKTAFTVAGAIDWLSTFGNTNVTQNVELRTLSGKQVKFRSGQEIPYVKGVGVSNNGSYAANNATQGGLGGLGGGLGSTQTDKVKTGLTVELTPRFDSDAELITCDIKMELKSVLEFVQLSAGNQIGTLTQPRTQEQELNDIVRLRAGQTAVIGGLQYDQEQFDGNEPTFVRDALTNSGSSFGRRAQDVQRNALFIIMRPVVTLYEPGGANGEMADLPARISK